MRVKVILLTFVLFVSIFAGCAQQAPKQPQTTQPGTTPDVTTTASIVDNEAAFEHAISKDGTWIIAIVKDLNINKDLVVDGAFKNRKNPPASQRKLAFYSQDKDRNVTARFTLTAPKMTINSPDCAIWYGTFKGDLYVAANNFQLIGAKVDGNIYFTTDEAKATYKMDADSKVTGVQELKK